MKASQVGGTDKYADHVLNHFERTYNWSSYINVKYDGLIPDNMPTKQQFMEIHNDIKNAKIQRDTELVNLLLAKKAGLTKIVKSVQKEWMRQQ